MSIVLTRLKALTCMIGLILALSSSSLLAVEVGDKVPINPDIKNEFEQAKNEGKILLVDFWADWCPWCVKMDGTFKDPKIAALVEKNFYYLKVDVGHFDKHQDCAKQYGATSIPLVLGISPDGTVVLKQNGYVDPAVFGPMLQQAIARTGGGPSIQADLRDVLAKAQGEGKVLLVDFSADWCPWCVKMDQTLKDPTIEKTLQQSFYYDRLDVGRFDKHKDCMAYYGVKAIPDLIAFDGDGEVVRTCNGYVDAKSFQVFLKGALAAANGPRIYNLDQFKGSSDQVRAAVEHARKFKRQLVVVFGGSPDCKPEVQEISTALADTELGHRYAILPVPLADNRHLATLYGCKSAPFIMILGQTGKVLNFFDGPATPQNLKSALKTSAEAAGKQSG